MKRRIADALALFSLLLCLALGALWVRSYWRTDYVIVGDPAVVSFRGKLVPTKVVLTANYRAPFTVPYWVPLLLAAVGPALWWHFHRRRRPRPGLCPACGYDLRGSPGPACPECGAAHRQHASSTT